MSVENQGYFILSFSCCLLYFKDIHFFNQCYLLKLSLNVNGLSRILPDNICHSRALQYESIFPESTDFCTAKVLQWFLSIYTYHLTSQTWLLQRDCSTFHTKVIGHCYWHMPLILWMLQKMKISTNPQNSHPRDSYLSKSWYYWCLQKKKSM